MQGMREGTRVCALLAMVCCIAMYSVELHMQISTRIHKKYPNTSTHINTHNHSSRLSLHIYLHTCIKQTHTNTHIHPNLIIQTHIITHTCTDTYTYKHTFHSIVEQQFPPREFRNSFDNLVIWKCISS